ncbi:universal stress protein [Rhodoblastus acidophilus]|uniref:Universal stress protein n=1 Tax=Candidatus Rhodoblastus alkanivorans TaxID=2954117 RepID=A0ABS9Z1U1_9HYPH|nr:universal stress protein [Candidatus Rhodoblastus alkanivorans]MCI4678035.1 universal stress protein [Candidatus Rhodoblastus alkanivorans]MCI4681624.1 universal stress protein [Candidatus Rhodoblastus alkanivorans]MDI4642672.1 universal stress protein [Rhodoblastus acidophilus]
MTYKTIQLLLNVNESPQADAAIDYAIELARREGAHLSVLANAQRVDFPGIDILPLADAIIAEVNDERLAKAKSLGLHIETSARLAGINLDCAIAQLSQYDAGKTFVAASRLSDLVIVSQPKSVLRADLKLIEDVLFKSGRPVLVVPQEWDAGPTLDKVVVAWDGGAKAARAASDAMPLLEKAAYVEVACATDDANDVRGAELARRLSRHGANVSVTNLPLVGADAGRTLMQHIGSMPVSLLVMGAFAHSRLVELAIGGVTNLMLNEARVPVLYSF